MSKKSKRRLIARTDDLYGLRPLSGRRWRQILAILGKACLSCGDYGFITRDHIVPLARGGLNHPANLQPLCRHCNNRKGDHIRDYRTLEQRAVILDRWPLAERVPLEEYSSTAMRVTMAEATG